MPLTNWQQFVSSRFPGKGANPSQQDYERMAQEFFGNIPLPPGIDESQVVNRTGGVVEYKDADGFIHRITRELDGRSPTVGQIREDSSNRPASQAVPGEKEATTNLLQQLVDTFTKQTTRGVTQPQGLDYWMEQLKNFTSRLGEAPAMGQLDPATQAALAAQSNYEKMALDQQFQEGQGNLIAKLFGTGTNKSSMAGSQAARLLQEQGLVSANQQANASQREIAIRQFLAQLGQGNLALGSQNALGGAQTSIDSAFKTGSLEQGQTNSLEGFVSTLLSQALGRDSTNSQFDLANRQFREGQRQYDQNSMQQLIQFQEQMRQMERQNFMNNLFKGVGLAASVATGIPGLFGGASANNAPMPASTTAPTPQFGAWGTPPLTPWR